MRHILIILFLALGNLANAQTYFYLEEVKLKKKDDFIENEKNAVIAIEYLMSTPIDENDMDRKACMRFILRYAEKTPHTTITLGKSVSELSEKNPSMLVFYMGLWLKSYINNKTGTTEDHEKYIFSEIYKYAKKGNNVVSSKAVKELIKAGDENKLDEWISKNKD